MFKSAALAIPLAVAAASAQRAPMKMPPKPEPGPAKVLVYPKVVFDSLPNGLTYAVVENHELPIVTVRTWFAATGGRGVWFLDPPGKAGAWGLMLASLREGTTTRSQTQITDEIADLGAEFTFPTTLAFTVPWFRTAKSTWTPSLNLLADVLMNPTFPSDGLSRITTNIAAQADRPLPGLSVATNGMLFQLYGADSPMNKFATGATLRATTRDDILALQRDYLRPQNTTIVVAGDVTPREVRAALTSAFGSWTRGGTTVTQVVPTPTPTRARTTIYITDTPGAAQATLVVGQVNPGRDHPDAVALEAIAMILGSPVIGSASRVFQAFRKDRGLSYSPRVELIERPIPEQQPMFGSATIAPGVADTAVLTYRSVLREVKSTRPITQAELDNAKANLVGSLPSQLERLDAVAADVLFTMRDRLPQGYRDNWIKRVNALTLAEVQAAAARYLDPDHQVIAVAGDRTKVEAQLRATGLPVVIVDK